MQVSVKLFGALRQYLPAGSGFNSCELTAADESLLSELLQLLPIPENKPFLVILNDEKVNRQDYDSVRLKQDDKVVLLPPIKGG